MDGWMDGTQTRWCIDQNPRCQIPNFPTCIPHDPVSAHRSAGPRFISKSRAWAGNARLELGPDPGQPKPTNDTRVPSSHFPASRHSRIRTTSPTPGTCTPDACPPMGPFFAFSDRSIVELVAAECGARPGRYSVISINLQLMPFTITMPRGPLSRTFSTGAPSFRI